MLTHPKGYYKNYQNYISGITEHIRNIKNLRTSTKPKNFNKTKKLDLIVLGQESSVDVKLSPTNIRVAKHLCPEL